MIQYQKIYDTYHPPLVICSSCQLLADFEKDGVAMCRKHMLRGSTTLDGEETCDSCFDDPATRGSISCNEDSYIRCEDPAHEYQIGSHKYKQMKEYFDNGDFEKPLPVSFRHSDITLIMKQTKHSRDDAIAAMVKHKGDIVMAIMELTVFDPTN